MCQKWHNALNGYASPRMEAHFILLYPYSRWINHHLKLTTVMDVTQIYAIVAGSLFAVLTTVNFCIHLWTLVQTYTVWVLRHIVYPFFLRRHRLVGPWSRRGFILRNIYILTNIFCSAYRTQTMMEAGKRTGILSLINLMPLFFGPHLDFLAKLMGVSLHNLHIIHGSAAIMSVLLSAAHAILSVLGGQWNTLAWCPRLYALLVSLVYHSFTSDTENNQSVSSLALLFFSFAQCIRRPSYELFLRAHQACAMLCAYSMWRHVTNKLVFPGLCIYISSGIFVVITAFELLWITYRNFTFHRGFSRAKIAAVRGAIRIKIQVRRPWNIRAGQYVNLWLPGVGYRALLESHPFMIVSWAVDDSWKPKLTTIELLVEPRDGFTHRLLRYASRSSEETKHLVLYSGPHGAPTSMKEYGSVLMIATGFGIAAILPHLKELVDGYERCEVATRRIHVVWQLKGEGL